MVLLKALVGAAPGQVREIELDARISRTQIGVPDVTESRLVRRSFLARAVSSLRSASAGRNGDVLLCFNSLPPLRRSRAKVITYVHAPHFVGIHQGIRYSTITSVRLRLERIWFRFACRNTDEVWVQTPTMANLLGTRFPDLKVRIVPLVDEALHGMLSAMSAVPASPSSVDSAVFFYPADTVGHKNHPNLLKAWALLHEAGCDAQLWLTIEDTEMRAILARLGLSREAVRGVHALGRMSRSDVLTRLTASSALIFPSLAETFGLPMLEASALGKPIIASERDFVRDVCHPRQTFDPTSPRSIARAVLRFTQGDTEITGPYYAADAFVAELLS
ncbi:putative Glycosyl transferase, group 1 [Cupriavidus taiwanensis]|nr:putative Glycosyl transferase, group 1 [Cupriavidus taiwanensis]SOZ24620.1 putative Glycosyl transferase, group 1 [Cupriavidus taiwanensis]SOZ44521.1 putative Glycosyl transferase, group 1 [Cupriavidus taiwanensis]